ncbi:hypothetical protein DAEQUDRAFT_756221 [Daedalea quercina L-15889]|uniref:PB1 domain-containing protein n=1 Tax=Daedalea quercina L-15889 TaxID=1314783 RepID=A0A165RCN6_9APHY|nr:hypothetical protein DAEQUDRAFT_756221 [Daedalea quercina L-15889]
MSSTTQINIKLTRPPSGLTRKVTFEARPSWDELATRIESLFDIPKEHVAVSYVDSDNDEVTMNTQTELQDYYDTQSSSSSVATRFAVRDIRVASDATRSPSAFGESEGVASPAIQLADTLAQAVASISERNGAHPDVVDGIRNVPHLRTSLRLRLALTLGPGASMKEVLSMHLDADAVVAIAIVAPLAHILMVGLRLRTRRATKPPLRGLRRMLPVRMAVIAIMEAPRTCTVIVNTSEDDPPSPGALPSPPPLPQGGDRPRTPGAADEPSGRRRGRGDGPGHHHHRHGPPSTPFDAFFGPDFARMIGFNPAQYSFGPGGPWGYGGGHHQGPPPHARASRASWNREEESSTEPSDGGR